MSIVHQLLESTPLADIAIQELPPLTDSDFLFLLRRIPLLFQKLFYGIQRHLVHPVNVMLLLLRECVQHRVETVEEVLLSWKGNTVEDTLRESKCSGKDAFCLSSEPQEVQDKNNDIFCSTPISSSWYRENDDKETVPPGIRMLCELTRQLLLPHDCAPYTTGCKNSTNEEESNDKTSSMLYCGHRSHLGRSFLNPLLLSMSLQLLCQRVKLKELFGAALPISLLEYLERVEDLHLVHGHEVSRSCARILIDLLRGSYVNKNRVSLLAGKRGFGAKCFARSGDIFLQMQCVEILFRLHLHNPSVFLVQVASASSSGCTFPTFIRDSISRLQNNERLLNEIVNLLNLYHMEYANEGMCERVGGSPNSVKAPLPNSLIRHVDVVNLTIGRGEAEMCGHASMYFSHHLVVVLLPRSSSSIQKNVDAQEERNTEGTVEDAASSSSRSRPPPDQAAVMGITHFTIPYEHVRSVRISRDHSLLLRLYVIPEALSLLMSLHEEGGDVLQAHVTDATLTFLRTSGIHQWIMERKKSTPQRIPLPTIVPTTTGDTVMETEETPTTIPTATIPPTTSSSSPSSTGNAYTVEEEPKDFSSLMSSFPPGSSQELLSSHCSTATLSGLATDSDGDAFHPSQRRPREEEGKNNVSSTPPSFSSTSLILLAEQTAERRTSRLRRERRAHLSHTREAVSAELDALHHSLSKEREQLQAYMQELCRNIAEVEGTMKDSAATSINTLNKELKSVQELGNMLMEESDTVRKEIAKAMGKVEGVETCVLRRVNEIVDRDLKELQVMLLKIVNETGPYCVIRKAKKKKSSGDEKL